MFVGAVLCMAATCVQLVALSSNGETREFEAMLERAANGIPFAAVTVQQLPAPVRKQVPPYASSTTKPRSQTTGEQLIESYDLLKSESWPSRPPRDLFDADGFNKCKVVFKDPTMATCHAGVYGGNFGDMIGPDVVKRIVEFQFGCNAQELPVMDLDRNETITDGPCLFTVGSVWRFVRPNDHVWGTGTHGTLREFDLSACHFYSKISSSNNITIYSVRGPKTVEALKLYYRCVHRVQVWKQKTRTRSDLDKIVPRGDGAFLLPFIFPEYSYSPDKADLNRCVVLHHHDDEAQSEGKFIQGLIPVNVSRLPVIQPWQTMVGNITRCKLLVSTSLHGLIVGDAFGVPVRWAVKAPSVLSYKFHDYYESFPNGHPAALKQAYRLKEAYNRSLSMPKTIDTSDRSEYARNVLETFPFHLFTTQKRTVFYSDGRL
jgi:hypothetical protein